MKILIAEDDRTSRTILKALLKKWGFEPEAVEDGATAWEVLNKPDGAKLALLDWNMPGMDGIEICSRLSELKMANPAYPILLTGNTKTDEIVRGLEAGASDYICKPYKNEELLARIRVGERLLRLQADLNEARRILAHQAMHDPLTNVYNRRAITDVLNHEISRTRRTGGKLNVAIFDLDHFKRVNDRYGHEIGDKALVLFVRTVEKTLRGSDYLGRWGGEEFLIIAPESEQDEPNALFERVREKISLLRVPLEEGDETFGFTVSAGVCRGTGEEEAEALIHAADIGLYRAKDTGRNKVVRVSVEESLSTE